MVCVHITHVLCGLHVNKSGKKENTKECTKEILVDHVNNKFKKNKKERQKGRKDWGKKILEEQNREGRKR